MPIKLGWLLMFFLISYMHLLIFWLLKPLANYVFLNLFFSFVLLSLFIYFETVDLGACKFVDCRCMNFYIFLWIGFYHYKMSLTISGNIFLYNYFSYINKFTPMLFWLICSWYIYSVLLLLIFLHVFKAHFLYICIIVLLARSSLSFNWNI